MIRFTISMTVFLLCGVFAWAGAAGQELGKLSTIDGQTYQPFGSKQNIAAVVVFVSPDCPIANAYHPELKRLEKEYRKQGISFVLVHSNVSTTLQQAKDHVQQFSIDLPVVLDQKQKLAKQLEAKTTPEAFLCVAGQEHPAYRGKIDNLYESYGKKRPQATKHYLEDAIQSVLQQQEVVVPLTKPVGCFIEYPVEVEEAEEPTPSASDRNSTSTNVEEVPGAFATQSPLRTYVTVTVVTGTAGNQQEQSTEYDPTSVKPIVEKELQLDDTTRKRTVPIRIYAPRDLPESMPVIILSHGLGGSRRGCSYLGEQWAGRGYLVVALQHIGSDESIWKNKPRLQIMSAVKAAASNENLVLRVEDVKFALDQITEWNQDEMHWLHGHLDLDNIGMSGHSFGAVTTQAICGQKYFGKARYEDTRFTAALPLSPSKARVGSTAAAFGAIEMPWLSMTGTEDSSPIGAGGDPESRREVYANLPNGDKYELVLDKAQHYAFGDEAARQGMPRNPNHHKAIRSLSTAFWDAYLKHDKSAKEWLQSDNAKQVLETDDQWLKK